MKLLLDEMWSPRIAEALRRRGHTVVAVTERPDLRTQPDSIIFERARTEGWVIVTEDVADYRELAAAALDAGLEAPALVFTSNRGWPRGSTQRIGRLVVALDTLLQEHAELEGEYWLD
ncbi:MAG: DUF5615 family PIN-like protein [Chloroflexi bacterium]|nr:DUF5615 family PIN-like protein [Chloroflexota bacterium]